MGDETGDLISQPFTRDDGDFLAYFLVNMEVQSETSVVLLDDHTGCLLDCFGTDTTLETNKKYGSKTLDHVLESKTYHVCKLGLLKL